MCPHSPHSKEVIKSDHNGYSVLVEMHMMTFVLMLCNDNEVYNRYVQHLSGPEVGMLQRLQTSKSIHTSKRGFNVKPKSPVILEKGLFESDKVR